MERLIQLGYAYSEAYSQWFDSIGSESMKALTKDCDRFIVTDQRKSGNLIETEVTSAFNIIGTSIHRAMQVAEFATGKVTRGNMECRDAKYEWVQRNKRSLCDQKLQHRRSGKLRDVGQSRPGFTWNGLPTHAAGQPYTTDNGRDNLASFWLKWYSLKESGEKSKAPDRLESLNWDPIGTEREVGGYEEYRQRRRTKVLV